MLDIKFIRENLEVCKTAAKNKNREVDWDRLLALDEGRRSLQHELDDTRFTRNEVAKKGVVGKTDKDIQEKAECIKKGLKIMKRG